MISSISVVIPVYNSEGTLDQLYVRLTAALEALCSDFEIILIDDGSRDESYVNMCRLHEVDKRVKAIKLQRNFGQQNAIMCGLQHAGGDLAITMDDDLQHPPEEIVKLIKKLDEGYDVVYGIPIRKMHSLHRNLGALVRDLVFNRISGKPASIKIGSFRVMKKSLVRKIVRDKTPFVYLSAMIFRITANVGNVEVRHEARGNGGSNYSLTSMAKVLARLFFYYSGFTSRFADRSRPQFLIEDARV